MRQLVMKRAPRISKRKRLLILSDFIKSKTATQTSIDRKVNIKTVHLYFNHIREKIYNKYSQAPLMSGQIELDHAFFGRNAKTIAYLNKLKMAQAAEAYGDPDFWKTEVKRKRRKKKKYKHIQVFGICQRGGNVYTHIIEKADKKTILPLVRMVVEPGSIIYTDGWAAFDDLKKEGYVHKSLNHSKEVSREHRETIEVGRGGINTSSIDRFWGIAKDKIGDFRGYRRRTFALHLKECEWRYNKRIMGQVGPKEKAQRQKEMLKELKTLIKDIL